MFDALEFLNCRVEPWYLLNRRAMTIDTSILPCIIPFASSRKRSFLSYLSVALIIPSPERDRNSLDLGGQCEPGNNNGLPIVKYRCPNAFAVRAIRNLYLSKLDWITESIITLNRFAVCSHNFEKCASRTSSEYTDSRIQVAGISRVVRLFIREMPTARRRLE